MGCPQAKPMEEWIKRDGKNCKPCMMGPVTAWYIEELNENRQHNLAKQVETSAVKSSPQELCKTLDEVKSKVEEKLRERLLDFDCAAQTHEP